MGEAKRKTCLFCPPAPAFHTAHGRSRPRLERDREYDEYVDRDMYAHGGHAHHMADDYRDRGLDRDRIPARDHRGREDEYGPHRGSSRRALNAI